MRHCNKLFNARFPGRKRGVQTLRVPSAHLFFTREFYRMRFNVYSELSYEVFAPSTFIFNIQPAKTATQTIIEETIFVNPLSAYQEFTLNNSDARFIKMEVSQGMFFTIACRARVEVQHRLVDEATLLQSLPISQLSNEV